jgi:hypothetical protein
LIQATSGPTTPLHSHGTYLKAFTTEFTCRSVPWRLGQESSSRKCGQVSSWSGVKSGMAESGTLSDQLRFKLVGQFFVITMATGVSQSINASFPTKPWNTMTGACACTFQN